MAVSYLGLFLAAFLLSVVLTRRVRNTATRRGWTAPPSAERHVHSAPIPRLGGVAIVTSFFAVTLLFVAGATYVRMALGFQVRTLVALLLPSILIFLVGLYDDLVSTTATVKFGAQIIAALMLFFGGFRVVRVESLTHHELAFVADLVLTVFWVVLITNAFNLLDGLDGLAAGCSLFSTLVVFAVALAGGYHLMLLPTIVLAGAILGFLPFNFNPATIFMGDCGSLFIGFMLGAVSLATSQKTPTLVAVAIPVVSFGLPILDTLLSVVRRFLNGQPLFLGDGEHIHHKLLKRGFSHRHAVILLYAVSAAFGLLSLLLLHPNTSTVGAVLAILATGVWVGVQRLGYHEFDELRRLARRTVEQKQVIINNLAIRRACEKLVRAQSVEDVIEILRAAFENNAFDAFEFQFASTRKNGETYSAPCTTSFSWAKVAGLAQPAAVSPAWSLRLELVNSAGAWGGFFAVSRNYSEQALLTDVNCLTEPAFATVLADALERASQRSKTMATAAALSSSPSPRRMPDLASQGMG